MPGADDKKEVTRREYRKKRRARNQLIAYIVSVVFVVACGVGLFFGANQILNGMEVKRQAEAAQLAAAQETEQQEAEVTQPVEEVVEEPVIDPLDELVDSNIATMTLEEKVAGMFYVTPEAITGVGKVVKAGDGTKTALETYPVGGLIYFAQNIVSDSQLKEMISNTIMYSKYPLFVGTDEEGGQVSRIANSKIEVTKVLTAAEIGEGDPQQAANAANTIASYMKEYGFNVNFAPVADVATNPENEMIGDRSYGADAAAVASMVKSAIQAYQEQGISACAKHWPGIGDIAEDLHESAGSTSKSLADMREMEFLPFVSAIEAGTDMIMVSHVSAPEITGEDTPSSLSSLMITDVLRNELGYNGIVITDAMNMSSITEQYTDAEAAVKAIQAGVDMILMPADFEAAYQGVLSAVADGTLTEERINESLHRIYRVKYADSLNATTENTEETTETGDTTAEEAGTSEEAAQDVSTQDAAAE